ncbi:MAG TPA: hypothetical protein DCL80_01215 [Balneola sp.]|nr:hypothetical protein [Balneola sp.]
MKKRLLVLFVFLEINFLSFAQEARIFKEDFIIEKQSFYPSEYELFRYVIFGMEENRNNFFIYDYSLLNLYLLEEGASQTFKVQTLGDGKGSGPREFRNPSDICIVNQKVIISDADLARISIWDAASHQLIRSFKTKKFVPYRIACYDDKIIAYNSSGSKEGNFLVYNLDGVLIKGITDNTLSKDGFIDSGYIVADSTFIYFGSEGKSELKKYNYLTGNLVQVSNTIVGKIENKSRISISKNEDEITTKRASDFKYQTRGIGLFENWLIVFHSGRKDAHGSTLDFYNKVTLEYLFSEKIDHTFSSIDIKADKLLINSYDFERKEREFFVYKIKND